MKRCTRCGETKPMSAFWKNAATPDGLQYRCSTCDVDARRERRRDKGATPTESAQRNAWAAAAARLRAAHRDEFDGYYRQERALREARQDQTK